MATHPPRDEPARTIARGTDDYPHGWLALSDPPDRAFVRGGRLPVPSAAVAIVGSRAATGAGRERAARLAGDLARLGLTIVSGLARGIDGAAHRGALEAGGRTVAVLPGSLEDITPRHHRELAAAIVSRGALVSEHPPGTAIFRGSFVERNRLIAALAGATVVVEAAERSGALSTATAAFKLGRPVLAVPGEIDRETSRGCHALLRRGAWVCEGAGDVIAALSTTTPKSPRRLAESGAPSRAEARGSDEPADRASGPMPPEARLLAALSGSSRSIDQLTHATGLTVAEALAALLALEWSGLVEVAPGSRWTRRTHR